MRHFVKGGVMSNILDEFGHNAGKIWTTLNTYGSLSKTNLIKKTRLRVNDFYVGIGWLARENKICLEDSLYKLGETNLTTKIGEDAGEVWNALNSLENIDISYIAKLAHIEEKDACLAVGWLAREDKIKAKKENSKESQLKICLK